MRLMLTALRGLPRRRVLKQSIQPHSLRLHPPLPHTLTVSNRRIQSRASTLVANPVDELSLTGSLTSWWGRLAIGATRDRLSVHLAFFICLLLLAFRAIKIGVWLRSCDFTDAENARLGI